MSFAKISPIDRAMHAAGIPVLVGSMLLVTSIAGFPGCVALAHALGPERAHEAVRTYFWIAFFTACAEGLALLVGVFNSPMTSGKPLTSNTTSRRFPPSAWG